MAKADSYSGGSVVRYIVRGLGYALTSALAMLAGYAIKHSEALADVLVNVDSVLLLVPLSLSVFFFITYSICFDYENRTLNRVEAMEKRLQREALGIGSLVVVLFDALIISVHAHIKGELISLTQMISFIVYGALFYGYGVYVLAKLRGVTRVLVRHQLVWPVILAIACSLQFGLYFDELSSSLIPLIPMLLLLALFVLSERNPFQPLSFAVWAVAIYTVTALTAYLTSAEWLASMIFCLSITTYLAVFEAWRITSHVAHEEASGLKPTESDQDGHSPDSATPATVEENQTPQRLPASTRYYMATLAALAVAGIIAPFVYIFSRFGVVFIIGFAVHAIVAFRYWCSAGRRLAVLVEKNWVSRKLAFGFLFLLVLVADSVIKLMLPGAGETGIPRFMPGFVSVSGLGLMAIPLLDMVGILTLDMGKLKKHLNLNSGMSQSDNYNDKTSDLAVDLAYLNLVYGTFNGMRILYCMFWIMCAAIVIAIQSKLLPPHLIPRADLAFVVYSAFMILIVISRIGQFKDDFRRLWRALKRVAGLLQTTRIPTSAVIGMIVFVPSIVAGFSFTVSFLSALPFSLAAMGGFALNDFFDSSRDKISKPHRAIPSGRLSRSEVMYIGVTLILSAFWVSLSFSPSRLALLLHLSAIMGVICYNLIVKYFAPAKVFIAAAICAIPVVYSVSLLAYDPVYYFLPAAAFVFIVGRELLMDIRDLEGDRQGGIVTIPMLVPPSAVARHSFTLEMAGATLLLPVVFHIGPFPALIPLSLVILSLIAAYVMWTTGTDRVRRYTILLLWLPMLLGLSMLLL